MSSPPVTVPHLNIQVPVMLLYLLANVTTQYVCISSVFVLTTECASLTVTLVITIRKFLSLIFSIIYFKNPFTIYHWIGTADEMLNYVITESQFNNKSRFNNEKPAPKNIVKSRLDCNA